MTDSLTTVQIGLEERSAAEGRQRYFERKALEEKQGEAESHGPHMKLVRGALPEVSRGVQEFLRANDTGSVGKRHTAVAPLSALDPDVAAFIGLRECFNAVVGIWDVRKTCKYIGNSVAEELWSSNLRQEDPKTFRRIFKTVKEKNSSRSVRMKSAKAIARKAGHAFEPFEESKNLKVGEAVLNAILEFSGLFERVRGEDEVERIGFTEEAARAIQEMEEVEQWMRPRYLPMVVRPRSWVSMNTGAYLTETLAKNVTLVRTYDRAHVRLIKESIRSGAARPFLDGLNAIQETAWAINRPILEMVEWAWAQALPLKKFPRRTYLEPVKFPDNYEDLDWRAQKGWRLRAARVREKNRGVDSQVSTMLQDLDVARTMAEYGAFYLPHNADFRGRIYAVPYFNIQRSDYIKAMFRFAEGKPLGEDGAYWLAIHLANCGDFGKVSKKSFKERVQWTVDNCDLITRVARDPKSNLDWTKADKPFSFLAACIEWAGYLEQGDAFVSHLPIALDGSNSGLQHYSAALRARQDGSYVNLTPSEVPADIYQEVANRVVKAIQAEAGTEPLADLWLAYGVDRSVVKRNVMTFAYSSETFGFKEQLIEDLMNPLEDEVLQGLREDHPFGDKAWAAAGYMAKHVWQAVTETVTKATEGMKFLQKVAGALAHERQPMHWVTPTGFPVLHQYVEWETKEVELFLYDRKLPVLEATSKDKVREDGAVFKRVRANLRLKPTTTIKKSKQRSAVAPNVIHSLDSSHLVLTVLAAKREGINSFALIHDSFATHAADTSRFFEIIRETMVAMYEGYDVFQVVYEAAMGALSEKGQAKLTPPPAKGDLSLSEITESLYCFA